MDRRSFLIWASASYGYGLASPAISSELHPTASNGYQPLGASRCYRQFTFDFNWLGGDVKDYFTKANPPAYADFCKQINLDAAVLLAVSHHGYCSYETKAGQKWPSLRGDWLGAQIEELHRRGIAAIAYITLARNWKYAGEHPEFTWPRGNETLICLNSPYLDLVVAYTQEVLKSYPVDALRYDTLEQATDHHCEGCKEFYRELYGEELPARWEQHDWRRQLDFQRASSSRAVKRLREAAREIKPSIETWHNGFIFTGLFDENDLNAGRMQDVAYVESGDPFRQLFLQGVLNLKGIIVGQILFSPIRRTCLALGAHCYSYQRVSRETLLPEDKSWFVKDLEPFYRMAAEVQPYLEGAKPLPYFGIVYSEATRYRNYMYDRSRYVNLLREITESYLSRSLVVEFINNLDLSKQDLSRFKLLVLPETSGLLAGDLAALRTYVRNGGKLLTTGTALLYDEKGFPLADFALAQEMGVSLILKPSEELNVRFQEGWSNKYLPTTINPNWWPERPSSPYLDLTAITKVRATQGKTVATCAVQEETWPIVHVNQYGKGSMGYSALSASMELLLTVIDTLVGPPPLSVGNNKRAILTHQPQLQRWILHLISDGDLRVSLSRAWGAPDRIVEQYPKQGFECQAERTSEGVTFTAKGEAQNRLLVLTYESN